MLQHLQRHLAANAFAIARIVESLLGQRLRQLRQRDTVTLRHFTERLIEILVVDADARALRALHLDLLQHQPLEHLLSQHRLWRHLEALRLETLADERDLFVDFAAQHHALVDHGGDAIEHHASVGQRARLRARLVTCAAGQ